MPEWGYRASRVPSGTLHQNLLGLSTRRTKTFWVPDKTTRERRASRPFAPRGSRPVALKPSGSPTKPFGGDEIKKDAGLPIEAFGCDKIKKPESLTKAFGGGGVGDAGTAQGGSWGNFEWKLRKWMWNGIDAGYQ